MWVGMDNSTDGALLAKSLFRLDSLSLNKAYYSIYYSFAALSFRSLFLFVAPDECQGFGGNAKH